MIEHNNEVARIEGESFFEILLPMLGSFGIAAAIFYFMYIRDVHLQIGRGSQGIVIPNFIFYIIAIIACIVGIFCCFLLFKNSSTIIFYKDYFVLDEAQYDYKDIEKINYVDIGLLQVQIKGKEASFSISISENPATLYEIDKLIEEKLDIKLVPTIKS